MRSKRKTKEGIIIMNRSIYIFAIIAIFLASCSKKGSNNSVSEPMIEEVSPLSGPPGTTVIISGSGFHPIDSLNQVSFAGTLAEVSQAGEAQIKTAVPEGVEDGEISVTVEGKTATGPSFTVELGAPGITSVEPDSGFVGDEITIKGMNFADSPDSVTVTFNGTEATVKSASLEELIVEVPEGATDGPVKVIARDQTAESSSDFDVITVGTIKTVVSTSGKDKDSNGYSVSIDGNTVGSSTTRDTTFYFGQIEQGTHTVELGDIKLNCSVPNNPRDVSVTPGDTTSTTFSVTCEAPPTGSVEVTTETTGSNLDDDGYMVTIGGDFETSVGINNVVTISDVPTGDFDVLLKNVASNCSVEGENPRSVSVMENNTSSVSFSVTCDVPNLIPYNGDVEFSEPMGQNGWRLPFGPGDWNVSVSDEQAHSGSQSFKVEIPNAGGGPRWNSETSTQFDGEVEYDNAFDTEAGKEYKISAWFYVESGAPGASGGEWQMTIRVMPHDGWSDEPKLFVALADFPIGQWVYQEGTFTASEDRTNKVQVLFTESNFTDNTVIFLDDVKVSEVTQ